jgi:hypothetical protein
MEKTSNPFNISRGVRHGDGLSATLFNLVLHKALKNLEHSNTIINRLTQICGYADDILVMARTLPSLEAMCEKLLVNKETSILGLEMSPNKTKYEIFSVPSPKISEWGNHKW